MSAATQLPRFSPVLHRWFAIYLRRYFARNFSAVRISLRGEPPRTDAPLIVYANHPSWWDPIHFLMLTHDLLPGRRIYGPMDADALAKYRLFERLGVFGVERDSRRGAATFVRTSLAVLEQPGSSLWLTPQGEFADVRRRPVALRPGLAHLVRRLDDACVVPLAVEYPFWNERKPEALSCFGPGIFLRSEPSRSTAEWDSLLASRLEQTMDTLADEARHRDPLRFRTLVDGRKGVGGVYDAWRRLRAWVRGESFVPAHGGE